MAKTNTISRQERIKSRKMIDELFNRGQKFNHGSFRVFYSFDDNEGLLKFGIGAGTRHFKKAVDRNRIKRLCREVWRTQNAGLKTKLAERARSLNVFLIYTSKELPDFKTIQTTIASILNKLESFVHEKNTPAS